MSGSHPGPSGQPRAPERAPVPFSGGIVDQQGTRKSIEIEEGSPMQFTDSHKTETMNQAKALYELDKALGLIPEDEEETSMLTVENRGKSLSQQTSVHSVTDNKAVEQSMKDLFVGYEMKVASIHLKTTRLRRENDRLIRGLALLKKSVHRRTSNRQEIVPQSSALRKKGQPRSQSHDQNTRQGQGMPMLEGLFHPNAQFDCQLEIGPLDVMDLDEMKLDGDDILDVLEPSANNHDGHSAPVPPENSYQSRIENPRPRASGHGPSASARLEEPSGSGHCQASSRSRGQELVHSLEFSEISPQGNGDSSAPSQILHSNLRATQPTYHQGQSTSYQRYLSIFEPIQLQFADPQKGHYGNQVHVQKVHTHARNNRTEFSVEPPMANNQQVRPPEDLGVLPNLDGAAQHQRLEHRQ